MRKYSIYFCLSVLAFFLVSMIVRNFTRRVLFEDLGCEKIFRMVFFDNPKLAEGMILYKANERPKPSISWAQLYPHENQEGNGKKKRKKRKHRSFEQKLAKHNKYLFGYQQCIEWAAAYERMLGFDVNVLMKNDVLGIGDGYLTFVKPSYGKDDDRERVRALDQLNKEGKAMGYHFATVVAPYKVSSADTGVYGVRDFSNQWADHLLASLQECGIETLDLRKEFASEDLHKLFFRSDHHWTQGTALRAAGIMCEWMNRECALDLDIGALRGEDYEQKIYPKWFLGSQGKKVTLVNSDPEDIAIFYPKFPTALELKVPNEGVHLKGDMSILYDMRALERIDYYNHSAYLVYGGGDKPVMQIRNLNAKSGCRMLVIKDSFVNCLAPFLSLATKELHLIDCRGFNGSLKSYIQQFKPDMVVMCFNAGIVSTDIFPGKEQGMR